jgi:hypothetical protein
MPEIKHNFTKSRMNKDFDERLVPNGEYRDALNVEISTSEGSNAGSVQNLKGNVLASEYDHNGSLFLNDDTSGTGVNRNAFTVASYVDESDKRIFNFVHKASDLVEDGSYASGTRLTGNRSDVITMFTAIAGTESGVVYPLVTDVYEVRVVPDVQLNDNFITGVPSHEVPNLNSFVPKNIRVGMRVKILGPDGLDALAGEEIYVTGLLPSSSANTTRVYFTPNSSGTTFNNQLLNSGFVFQFTSERVLNFVNGVEEIEDNVSGKPTTFTPKDSLITAINYEGNILFYTDGRNEPKRIAINDFLENKNYITGNSVDSHSIVRLSNTIGSYLEEKDITVIRKNPRLAPTVIAKSTKRATSVIPGSINSQQYSIDTFSVIYLYNQSPVDSFFSFMNAAQDAVVASGTSFDIFANTQTVNWRSGDVLQLTGTTTSATARVKISSVGIGADLGSFTIQLIDIDESYFPEGSTSADAAPEESWNAILVDKQKIYPDTFLYFAYRYKYNNNEYSAISPYSKAVFIPNFYSYNAVTGFNVGMENQLRFLQIVDFVEDGIGNDVTSVEILMKTSASENAYVVRSIKSTESEFISNATGGANKGEVNIEDIAFGRTLDSLQLVRPFDAVPVKAKAQEFSSNRLMYGNHTQGYDILDNDNQPLSANIDLNIVKRDIVTVESLIGGNSVEVLTGSVGGEMIGLGFVSGVFQTGGVVVGQPGAIPIKFEFDVEVTDDLNQFDLSNNQFVCNFAETYDISFSVPNFRITSYGYGDSSSQYPGVQDDNAFAELQIGIYKNGTLIESTFQSQTNLNNQSSHDFYFNISVSKTVSLSVGDVIDFRFLGDAGSNTRLYNNVNWNTNGSFPFTSGNLTINGASNLSVDVISSKPFESVKSMRDYQVGVVYGDYYGRESEVLIDSNNLLNNSQQNSVTSNKLECTIKNTFPAWADYYKFFVKEVTPEYYNLVLFKAYANDGNVDSNGIALPGEETVFFWLSFNSIDRNKIELDDYIVLKKVQSLNTPPLLSNGLIDTNARWRVLDIVDSVESTEDNGDVTFSVKGVELNASKKDVSGKFFVKIIADSSFDDYIGFDFAGNAVLNGAVFEVEKKKTIDLDLFYEASQAYPIKLKHDNVHQYVRVGSSVTMNNNSQTSIYSYLNQLNVTVTQVIGAKSMKTSYPSSCWSHHLDHFVSVSLQITNDPSTSIKDKIQTEFSQTFANNIGASVEPFVFTLSQPDGSFVTLRVVELDTVNNKLKAIPFSHPYNSGSSVEHNTVCLPWFNCFSFGNGVESDRIRDDFNASVIYSYTANGKQSGFKASLPITDYYAKEYPDEIIFSQIFNDATNTARYNEFIYADNITKRINSEYGSVQKLYTREGDVLAFCESKVLKILASKDALFNADGDPQLLSSTAVLGQIVPFAGDYGISTNPESFAVEEYRIYFADKARGSICRLSMNGITAISDAGMNDWFNDNLETASVLIGSYDGKKDEYNLTIHASTNPGSKKDVYTLSYSETSKGWVSFKSFIKESGLSLSNEYYTFKNGDMYLHHPDQTAVDRNNFYGTQYTSTIDVLFNDFPGSVKLFKTINYEGTQSKEI